jgi:hypothetical protein
MTYGPQDPSVRIAHAVGETVINPVAAGMNARMFAQAGERDPHKIMILATGLARSNQMAFLLTIFTGPVALLLAALGGHCIAVHTDVAIGIFLMVTSFLWLWTIKIFNGYILHYWLKDCPKKLYHYLWWFPVTLRGGLRLTNIHNVIKEDTSVKERGVIIYGTIMWFLFIRLPLYITVAFCAGNVIYGMIPGLHRYR